MEGVASGPVIGVPDVVGTDQHHQRRDLHRNDVPYDAPAAN